MRFKIDENLPVDVADLLRSEGHDAPTVLEQTMSGRADLDIAAVCQREGRVLVTPDVDFANIRAYPPDQHAGIMVLRLQRQDKLHVLAILRRLLPLLKLEAIAGRLWIVDEERVRIRG